MTARREWAPWAVIRPVRARAGWKPALRSPIPTKPPDPALVLQPHLLERGGIAPALLVVAAVGERLFVAPVGGPMPEKVRADGIVEPVEGEDAPQFRHGEGHNRNQANGSRGI